MEPTNKSAVRVPKRASFVTRRSFLQNGLRTGAVATAAVSSVGLSGGLGLQAARAWASQAKADDWFKISLAQWSLHQMHGRPVADGGLDNLGFPSFTKKTFGIDAVEYVNRFFRTVDKTDETKFVPRGSDFGYLRDLRSACDDAGVESVLIMVDGEGKLADAGDARRREAVENHFKWVAAAAFLGCHSIRVNAAGKGERDAQRVLAADSLSKIARVAKDFDIRVIVENHGGLSSDGAWLKSVMETCDDEYVGTLPDFGNFGTYDRYQGIRDLMPHAKAVSAKTHEFDDAGNEVHTDYEKAMKIVRDAGYRGYVGIEYEGKGDEVRGIEATRDLLMRVRDTLSESGSDK